VLCLSSPPTCIITAAPSLRRSVPVPQGKRCLPVPLVSPVLGPSARVGFVLYRPVPRDQCHFCVVSSTSRLVRPIVKCRENGIGDRWLVPVREVFGRIGSQARGTDLVGLALSSGRLGSISERRQPRRSESRLDRVVHRIFISGFSACLVGWLLGRGRVVRSGGCGRRVSVISILLVTRIGCMCGPLGV
jgi:hypothetical protein